MTTQRSAKKNGDIDKDNERRLNEIGFWDLHHKQPKAARGPKWADAVKKASQLRAKDWQLKARDSLDAKEKRANEVLAALESAKQSSTATPAPVAADAGSEKHADACYTRI